MSLNQEVFYDLRITGQTLQTYISKDAWEYTVDAMDKYGLIPIMEDLLGEQWIRPDQSLPTTFGFNPQSQFKSGADPDWILCETSFPKANESARPHACTLKTLFTCLWLFSYNQSTVSHKESQHLTRPQLLTMDDVNFDGKGQSEFGLSVTILSPLAKWIAAYNKEGQNRWIHPEISQTMQEVAIRMRGPEWFDKYPSDLRACHCEFSDYSGAYFNCYGDVCDLGHGGAHNSNSDPIPYTIGPHNCDNFLQQFVLLAGVAKLCEVARRELMPKQNGSL